MKCLACYGEVYSIETGEYHPRCSKLLFDSYSPPVLKYSLDEARSISGASGSIFLEVQKIGSERRLVLPARPSGGSESAGSFFLRLPGESHEQPAELESTTLDIAHILGVHTAKHGFAKLSSGELAFIARRFGFAGDNTNKAGSYAVEVPPINSMEEAGKLITELSDAPGLDAVRFLERIVFCSITGAADVNFSMHSNGAVGTRLTNAYDLFPNGMINAEQNYIFNLPLNGRKTGITKNDFLQLASSIRVNRKAAENVFDSFSQKIWEALGCMDKGFLHKDTIEKYRDFIKERASLISL